MGGGGGGGVGGGPGGGSCGIEKYQFSKMLACGGSFYLNLIFNNSPAAGYYSIFRE